MNLYAYTIATMHTSYHECICATDRDAAVSAVLAAMLPDEVLIELELV